MSLTCISINSQVWTHTLTHEGEPVLYLSLSCPNVSEPAKRHRRISSYYCKLATQCRAYWEDALFHQAVAALALARESSRPFFPWTASLCYTITYQQDDVLSIFYDLIEQHGSSRPLVLRAALTWDLHTGFPRSLHSLFPADKNWKEPLLDAVSVQASQQLASGESLLDSNSPTTVHHQFDPTHYYLTDQSVILFYPMYSIAPYAEGIPSFAAAVTPIPLPSETARFSLFRKKKLHPDSSR